MFTNLMDTSPHKQVTITYKKQINSSLFVLECPICKKWVASASEKTYLPQFSTCDGTEPKILTTKNKGE